MICSGGAGNDTLGSGGGTDTASYSDAASAVAVDLRRLATQVTLGTGSDRLVGIENLTGSAFNDTLTGNAVANVLIGGEGIDHPYGGKGNDLLMPGEWNFGDVIDGGLGGDTASFADVKTGVNFYLGNLLSVETVIGSAFDDDFQGTDGKDKVYGAAGADLLFGGGDNDILFGGAGNDTIDAGSGLNQLSGGAGADQFNLVGACFA